MTHRACTEQLAGRPQQPEGSSDVRAVPNFGTCAGARAGPAAEAARTVPLVIGGLIAIGLRLLDGLGKRQRAELG